MKCIKCKCLDELSNSRPRERIISGTTITAHIITRIYPHTLFSLVLEISFVCAGNTSVHEHEWCFKIFAYFQFYKMCWPISFFCYTWNNFAYHYPITHSTISLWDLWKKYKGAAICLDFDKIQQRQIFLIWKQDPYRLCKSLRATWLDVSKSGWLLHNPDVKDIELLHVYFRIQFSHLLYANF